MYHLNTRPQIKENKPNLDTDPSSAKKSSLCLFHTKFYSLGFIFRRKTKKVTMHTIMIFPFLTMIIAVAATGDRYEVGDNTNVSLPCNYTIHNAGYPGIPIPFKRYWILPNATVVPDTYLRTDGRIYLDRPTLYDFNLVIIDVHDDDYGLYHCVMIWNNIDYGLTSIPVGLNEDGPRYKRELEDFERAVIIGGIIAGGVVLIIFIIGIVCFYKLRKQQSDRSFDDDITYQASDEFSTKYGYGGNQRKHPSESTEVRQATESPRSQEVDTGVYAKVDKSKMLSVKGSSNQSDSVTDQSVRL